MPGLETLTPVAAGHCVSLYYYCIRRRMILPVHILELGVMGAMSSSNPNP
jgi:hypothetical protein